MERSITKNDRYTPNDSERAMYIYRQRKEEKRTFTDIGRDLGITGNRVRLIYKQMDWKLNGFNADHHLQHPERMPETEQHKTEDDT